MIHSRIQPISSNRTLAIGALLFFWVALSGPPLLAQPKYQEVYQIESHGTVILQKMPLLLRTYPVYVGQGLYRLYFLVEVQFDYLQFVLQEGEYRAEAELEVHLTHLGSGEKSSRIWQTRATAASFEETNRRDIYHFTVDSAEVAPGRYQVLLKYRDQNALRRFSRKLRIFLPEVASLYASPPLLLYSRSATTPALPWLTHVPSALRNYWDFGQDMYLYLTLAPLRGVNPVPVHIAFVGEEKQPVVLVEDTLRSDSVSQRWFREIKVPTHQLPEGKYQLQVHYRLPGDSLELKQGLTVVWFSRPRSLWNFKEAVKVMQYLMDEEEFQAFSRGSEQEVRRRFEQYWREHDPTPDTPFNELMAEFYTRVDSANMRYSSKGQPGWRTDIGRIYILYGPPARVEDHSLDPVDFPYLRWYYLLDGKELIFTFHALEGRRDYQLVDVKENPLQ